MKGNMFRKGLVVGIIVLFIGVGFQPAFANEVSITNKTSDFEEDCNCNPVSNLHLIRLERMVNRLVVYNNILSLFSKYNPEFKEKYQEISNRISTLKETNNELKLGSLDGDYPIICAIILIIIIPVYELMEILNDIEHKLREEYPRLASLIDIFSWQLIIIYAFLGGSIMYFNCNSSQN